MKKNKELLLFSILFLIVLLGSISLTYAYFTARSNLELLDKLEVSSGTVGQAYATSGSKISFDVPKKIMGRDDADDSVPVATAENDLPIVFTLETSSGGEELRCLYDIIYIAGTPYYSSPDNLENKKELVLSGAETQYNELEFDEVSLNDVENYIMLKKDVPISVKGIKQKIEHNWTITVGYYNNTFKQDENAYKNFSGDIEINNIRCETFVK